MIIKRFPDIKSRRTPLFLYPPKELFATINQCMYIFGSSITKPTSGSIIIINMKKYNSVVIAYMDNFKGQITLVHLVHGNMTMKAYIRFVNDLIHYNLLVSLVNPKDLGDQLDQISYYRVYTPKNFNRDWFGIEMSTKYCINFISYSWKDEFMPKAVKDFHKILNSALYKYHTVSIEIIEYLVSMFNNRTIATLREMFKNTTLTAEEIHVNLNVYKNDTNLLQSIPETETENTDDSWNEDENTDYVNLAQIQDIQKPSILDDNDTQSPSNSNPPITTASDYCNKEISEITDGNVKSNISYPKTKLLNNKPLIHTKHFHSSARLYYSEGNIQSPSRFVPDGYVICTFEIDINGYPVFKIGIAHIMYDNSTYTDYSMQIDAIISNFKRLIEVYISNKSDDFIKQLRFRTQLKIQLVTGEYRSITAVDTIGVSENDFKYLENSMVANFNEKSEQRYQASQIQTIFLSFYRAKNGIPVKHCSHIKPKSRVAFTVSRVGVIVNPSSDCRTWGDWFINPDGSYTVNMKGHYVAKVYQTGKSNYVTITNVNYSGSTNFVDHLGKNSTSFVRVFKLVSYTYENGELIRAVQSFEQSRKGVAGIKFIKKLSDAKVKPKDKFIVFDLETRLVDGSMQPICISWISSVKPDVIHTRTIDYYDNDPARMIKSVFKNHILKAVHSGFNVYAHNFSNFDGFFVIKEIQSLPNIKVTMIAREATLISAKIQFTPFKDSNGCTKYKHYITLNDSFLILPVSLEKLSRAYGESDSSKVKSIFPLKFLNKPDFDINYKGEVPSIKYFYQYDKLDNIKMFELFVESYNKYAMSFKGKIWNLKSELIAYCEQDVVALYNVIIKYTKNTFEDVGINSYKYPTISSNAFATFRKKFMKEENIPVISGGMYQDIKQAYYGGIVDVYRPFARKVKAYDINSLYPSVMFDLPVPTGIPKYISGLNLKLSEFFGFVRVKVEAPLDMFIPILPYKSEKLNTTIFPTGTWEGWYFSEEVKNAEKFGYKFKVLEGFTFEPKVIFNDYVKHYYDIKVNAKPNSAELTQSKLKLNSLYGRFGMNPVKSRTEILTPAEYEMLELRADITVQTVNPIGDNLWVVYFKTSDEASFEEMPNISVGISAAISAWSRIKMTEYLTKYSNNMLYVDTDGIKMDTELDPKYVGRDLGLMKDEGSFTEGIFISPKVYGIINKKEAISKVKGFSGTITYWLLKTLIYGSKLSLSNERWKRSFYKATIEIINQLYTIYPTGTKRRLVLDSSGVIIGSQPYKLVNGEIDFSGYKVWNSPMIMYYLPKFTVFIMLNLSYFISKSKIYNIIYPSYNPLLSSPYKWYHLKRISSILVMSFNLLGSSIIDILKSIGAPSISYPETLPPFISCKSISEIVDYKAITFTGTLAILGYVRKDIPDLNIIYLPAPYIPVYSIIYLPSPVNASSSRRINLKVTNIITGEVLTFESIIQASIALNINKSIISRRLSNKIISPYKKLYEFSKV